MAATTHPFMGTFHHPGLAAAHADKHAVLQKGVKPFLRIESGRCMGDESGGQRLKGKSIAAVGGNHTKAAQTIGAIPTRSTRPGKALSFPDWFIG